MTRITLDPDLRSRLNDLKEPVELCDEAGRVVGRVFPIIDVGDYELAEPGVNVEELRRREQADARRYSTDEVLEHLENI
ncbi:MAG: hypothetical protein ACE5KM_05540 [Planctomycetaceae bacterium]